MKCPKCNGTGIDDDRLICYECDGTGEYEPFDADVELDKLDDDPMTNEEWFCSLSTEEKARFFDKICYSAWGDINSRFRDMADYTDWVEWLKEKHNG